MKILQINKFYYLKGGSEKHFFELTDILEKRGHEVVVFSTENEKNIKNERKAYFIKELEMSLNNFKNGLKLFYNREAIKELEKIISEDRPDVAHIHNISHHFSPAIIKVLKKNNIPVVMTAHDYKLVCPNYKLFNEKGICEKCLGGKYYQCALNKCVKDSYFGSLIMAVEAYWVKWKGYFDYVDIFIAPSRFMKGKLIEGGIDEKKIKYIPNFLNRNSGDNILNVEGEHILYFGRLSREKGVDILINAFSEIIDKKIKLKIAGDGEELSYLKELSGSLGLESRVEFLGHRSKDEMQRLIGNAKFTVAPSVWHENASYSILESFAQGKAVIGSDLGGTKEIIIDHKSGLIFKSGDSKDLAEKINYLLDNPAITIAMGKQGRIFLKEKFSVDGYYEKLIGIYDKLK